MQVEISNSNVSIERENVIFDKEKALEIIESCPFLKDSFNAIIDFNALSKCSDDFVIGLADLLIDYGIILLRLMNDEK